jgi:hypothetical protein
MIVIPQDPGPLLQILPSPELRLDNLIRVFWLGHRAPADADLKPFLQVRKERILAALRYLVQHNHLYRDLTVNYAMIDDWSSEFIPTEIRDSIVCLGNSDHHEREGYTVNLQTGNYENDLDAAQDALVGADDHEALVSGSIYTDVNGERQDPDVRLVHSLQGMIAGNPCVPKESANMPTISYVIRGQSALMNSWEDPRYFTAAFPTLFPTGIGGHQEERTVPLSLAAFAEWAMNHYNRMHVSPSCCCESLINFADSHVIRHSCILFMMYCSSEARLLEMHFSSSAETGEPPKTT